MYRSFFRYLSKRIFPQQKNKQETPYHVDPVILKSEKSLAQRLTKIKEVLGDSNDVIIREVRIGTKKNILASLVFIDGMVANEIINAHILKPLMLFEELTAKDLKPGNALKVIQETLLTAGRVEIEDDLNKALINVLSGGTALLIDGFTETLLVGTSGFKFRNVEEPVNEPIIRGPSEGFNENLRVNTSLLRRRLRTPHLRFESYILGRETNTEVVICYLRGIAKENIIDEVRDRLKRIDIDSILETGYIEELIEDNPFSIFPQIEHTERPDKLAAMLLEGKVGIMMSNTPVTLIVPTTFFQFIQSSEDYYQRSFWSTTFFRWLRLAMMFSALFAPSFYIAIVSFHQEMLPVDLLLSIAAAREGIPFPAVVEALIMETVFEVLREAGVRLPKTVGQAVSIVGALIVGEAAIIAGLVSPAMVIIVALTGITSFAIPGFKLVLTLRLLRFVMMLLAGFMGLFGIMVGSMFLLIHLVSIRSFGAPYLSPIAPFNFHDFMDTFFRLPTWARLKRPSIMDLKNKQRLKPGLEPKK